MDEAYDWIRDNLGKFFKLSGGYAVTFGKDRPIFSPYLSLKIFDKGRFEAAVNMTKNGRFGAGVGYKIKDIDGVGEIVLDFGANIDAFKKGQTYREIADSVRIMSGLRFRFK